MKIDRDWIKALPGKMWLATRIPRMTHSVALRLEARGYRALGFICRHFPLLVLCTAVMAVLVHRALIATSWLERSATLAAMTLFVLNLGLAGQKSSKS